MRAIASAGAIAWLLPAASAFAFRPSSRSAAPRLNLHAAPSVHRPLTPLFATPADEEEVATVQILMSDTGGGHRASANALRDAFNVLHETEPARFPLKVSKFNVWFGNYQLQLRGAKRA